MTHPEWVLLVSLGLLAALVGVLAGAACEGIITVLWEHYGPHSRRRR